MFCCNNDGFPSSAMNPNGTPKQQSGGGGRYDPAEQRTRLILLKAAWAQQQARAAEAVLQQQQPQPQPVASAAAVVNQATVSSSSPVVQAAPPIAIQPPQAPTSAATAVPEQPQLRRSFIAEASSLSMDPSLTSLPSIPVESIPGGMNGLSFDEPAVLEEDHDWTCPTTTSSHQPQQHLMTNATQQLPDTTNSSSIPPPYATAVAPHVVSATPSVAESPDPPMVVPPFLLHQACTLYPTNETVVKGALKVDPPGIRRRLFQQGYTYPINIALQHNASFEILQMLANAAPDVLVQPDGPTQCCTLTCALLFKHPLNVISMLLQVNPNAIQVTDRRENTPLHVACVTGSGVDVIRLLAGAYPLALSLKNFHGQTPLTIARQTTLCSDDVIDCLQQATFGELEQDALTHLDDLDTL